MEAIMQKLQDQLQTMKESLAIVQSTYETRATMIKEAPVDMPYTHIVITDTFIKDLDQDTVIMLDMFETMQDNMSSATDICRKIIRDHEAP
ncbi:unnamed protein product [Lactuca virosa]|uniref:Uncharacterized protein n=1 Tax=Lactuca virosa TaxID=75947 RepID=A0AAU9P9Q3_9ASTR|nr:unnamed protein product [Lactuca virosa]CAH1446866.1 unnamed protein product [Lactuca virosa]